jgi:alpha-tubulin suppressor-like RCC1 family protein
VAIGERAVRGNEVTDIVGSSNIITNNDTMSGIVGSGEMKKEQKQKGLAEEEIEKGCMIFTWGENNRGQLGRDTNGMLYDKFVGHVKLESHPIAPPDMCNDEKVVLMDNSAVMVSFTKYNICKYSH